MQKNNNKTLIWIGAIFLVVGLIIGGFAAKHVVLAYAARDWQPVPMTILNTDLKVSRNDNSDVYKVTANYRYEFKDQSYTGNRVWFGSGSDNISDFHERTHHELRKHLSGLPFTGFVNPKKPDQSVLIRDIRWGVTGLFSLFPAVFGGLGCLLLLFGFRGAKQAKITETLEPDQRWRSRNNWQTNQLESTTVNNIWFIVGFTVFWCLLSSPVAFFIPEEVLEKQNYFALIGLLFPLVGIGLMAYSVRLFLQSRKFGRSQFIMDPFPAHPGGLVRGVLKLQNTLQAEQLLSRLSYVQKITSGSGKNRKTREHIRWQDEQVIKPMLGQREHEIAHVLPADAKHTDYTDSNHQRFWRLSCQAEVPGIDFSATFNVPVIAGEPAIDILQLAEKLEKQQVKLADQSLSWQSTGVLHSHFGGYPTYRFPAGMRLKMAFILGLFGLVFGGIGVALIHLAKEWFIGGIFAFVGSLILLGMLHSLFYRSQVTIKPNKLEVIAGVFRRKPRTIVTSNIQSINMKKGSSYGAEQYWNIYIQVKSTPGTGYGGYKANKTQKLQLAADLKGKRPVESLIRRWKKELRIEDDEI